VCLTLLAGCETPQNQKAPPPVVQQQKPKPKPAPKPVKAKPQPSLQQVTQMLEPDVLGVVAYYNSFDPWIWDESHSKITGIIIQALFLSGPNVKGVFGDGIIRPKMYMNESGEQWKLAKEWSFDVEQSISHRSKKETMQGWGYRFDLPFDDLDLNDQAIRMVVEFDRSDGRIVRSGKKDFRTPNLKGSQGGSR